MTPKYLILTVLFTPALHALAEVTLDGAVFGKTLGGWRKIKSSAAEYPLSGAEYRTYKPEISPTPDGGIFISIRIDHVRGWLASDDHANLEITVDPKGAVASAQSTIAIQGQSIKSDVIIGANVAGAAILSPERAVQIGSDLVANLTAKLLRENIVEAGRVSLPSVLRHNYNRLLQAIRVDGLQISPPIPTAAAVVAAPAVPATNPPPVAPTSTPEKSKEPTPAPLEIKPYTKQ